MKQVVGNALSKVSVDAADETNIYAFKDQFGSVYKLHRVGMCDFAFIAMHDTMAYYNGVHGLFKGALENTLSQGKEIYEFEDETEFLEWAAEGEE